MARWAIGGHRTGTVIPLATVALFGICSWRVVAQECNNCVTPAPILEAPPGVNLHWQLPGHYPDHYLFSGCETPSASCSGYYPAWYTSGELLPLRRDSGRSFDFAALGPGGPIVLGSNHFEDDFEAGARVVVGRALGDWYRLEASWFGAYQWRDSAAVRTAPGNLFSPFSAFGNPAGVNGLDFNELAAISFSSELNNVELNLRRGIALLPGPFEASFLLGVRYLNIEEDFRYLTTAAAPGPSVAVNDIAVNADNEMIGIQIGLLTQYQYNSRSWIDLEIKGAIFSNDASQNTVYQNTTPAGASATFDGNAQEDTTAYMGDLSLIYNYQFSRALTFRIGYNAIFLTGVALGADNFETNVNILQLGPAALDHRGRVIYHGPNAGVVWAW